MNIYCLTSLFSFIQNAIAYIDIKGELTFHFYPTSWDVVNNVSDGKTIFEMEVLQKNARANNDTTGKEGNSTDRVAVKTSGKEDCVYQYPDRKQVEALLSDMMNHLTKIFVRAYEYVARRGARRGRERRRGRRIGKRFKIVRQKFDSRFFEEAYKAMSDEYRQSMNASAEWWRLANHDPCHHQREIKALWRRLLERAKSILKRAAVRCVSDFLRVRNRADDARTKERLAQLLLREIREVRSNQLKVLCDDFKLCYKDLLYGPETAK